MWIEARVTQRGTVCPAFQVDECFCEEVSKWKWHKNSKGYIKAAMGGKTVLLARYVWLLHSGDWPKQDIDHINRDKLDNRIANLRDVSCSENAKNKTPLYQLGKSRNKSSGLPTGVEFNKRNRYRPYTAQVWSGGKTKHLGCFATPEEASACYQQEIARIRNGEQ